MFEKLPSRKPTYPTWGKGKSSSNMPYQGDMLVPWRVVEMLKYHGLVMNVSIRIHSLKTNMAPARKPSQKETHLQTSVALWLRCCVIFFRGCIRLSLKASTQNCPLKSKQPQTRLPSLKLTAKAPRNNPSQKRKRESIPTIHFQRLPSRELTYPTLGKGKSSSKCHFLGIC